MRTNMKRINLMISEDQYEEIQRRGLNLSAFIRDLIEDHFSDHVIKVSVSPETYRLYNQVISNTGATDKDVDPLLVETLGKLLDVRLNKIKDLKSKLK